MMKLTMQKCKKILLATIIMALSNNVASSAFAFDEMRWNSAMVLASRLAQDNQYKLSEELLYIALKQEPEGEALVNTLINLAALKTNLATTKKNRINGKINQPQILAAKGFAEQALDELKKAKDASTTSSDRVYHTLATVYLLTGDTDKAQEMGILANKNLKSSETFREDPATGLVVHTATGLYCPKTVNVFARHKVQSIKSDGSEMACSYSNANGKAFITAYLLDKYPMTAESHAKMSASSISLRYKGAEKKKEGKMKPTPQDSLSSYYISFDGINNGASVTEVYVIAFKDKHMKFRVTRQKDNKSKNSVDSFFRDFDYGIAKGAAQ